jgi:Fe(II)/alpha-ketoglutarate-dependent arginine beta-hydroxylase
MHRAIVSPEEISSIRNLLAEVTSQYQDVEDESFLKDASFIAHELPRRIRAFLNDFKQLEMPEGACLLSAYPVDDERIGPTPEHWKFRNGVSPTLESEMLFVLLSSLLGDVIGWATQQNGHLIHEVLPIKSDENEQISTGSKQTIWWHNEDAFHPYRGDYVGLMCLRNPDQVPTTFTSLDSIRLGPHHLKTLFEPRFIISPDESHAAKNNSHWEGPEQDPDGLLRNSYEHLREMHQRPKKVAVLFGSPQSPYIRIDPYFMDTLDDEEAQCALNALVRAVDARLSEIVLQPGEYLFVDNYRAVHGRKSFTAKYDGTDRWLKRMNITRDLRKSRDARLTSVSRTIF